jgi:hypothetical protein
MTGKSATKRVTARKSGGDDLYSWAVFVDGRTKWTGMSRSEAQWRKSAEIKRLETMNEETRK